MTNDQLIAMLFPVGAGIAAVAAGYVGLRWIAPQPVDEPKQALNEAALRETPLDQNEAAVAANASADAHASSSALKAARLGRARQSIRAAEREIDELISSNNGGNF